jgi:hypothetical protein
MSSDMRGASVGNRSFAVALRGIPVALCGFTIATALEELGRSELDLTGPLMCLRRPLESLNSSTMRTVRARSRRVT